MAVLGLASSSQAGLLAEIGRLGTNLLTVTNGQDITGQTAELPDAAPGMIGRLPGVLAVQYTATVGGASVYRSPLVPPIDTDGLTVNAASLGLPAAAGTSVAQGSYLNAATAGQPVAVLGAEAAQLLGIDRIWPGERIWVGGQWFYLVGILNPAALAPQIDTSVLVGFPAAERYLGLDGHPSEIYVRTVNTQAATTAVDNLLAAQANPENPSEVNVSQPSAALTAQADAAGAFDTLFLGLGAVALLVGAVGRGQHHDHLGARTPPGDRPAAGARRHQGPDPAQFLAEAILLALAGGAAGDIAGAAATAVYAHAKGWAIVIPPEAWAGGLGAALLIGALAGLLPAIRAARLSPTQALWACDVTSGMLAADRDDLAGQVGGVVAGQEDHDVGDLPGLGRAPERLPADQLGQHFLARHLGQERVHGQARRDRVDPDAVRGHVERGAAGQRHHPGLGRRVVRLAGLRAPAEHRGVVHHRSPVPLGDHLPQRRPGAPEGAVERDVEHPQPLLVGHVEDRAGAAEPGVVDQHVDAPEGGDGAVDQRRRPRSRR